MKKLKLPFLGVLILTGCSVDTMLEDDLPVVPEVVDGVNHIYLMSSGENEVSLVYSGGGSAPRMAELHMRLSENAAIISIAPGEAAIRAGKEVVMQMQDEVTARIMVFASDNVHSLESGALAVITFLRLGEGVVTGELLPQTPILAPSAAEEGLLLGDPIQL